MIFLFSAGGWGFAVSRPAGLLKQRNHFILRPVRLICGKSLWLAGLYRRAGLVFCAEGGYLKSSVTFLRKQ